MIYNIVLKITDLANLISDVDKLDVNKLKNKPSDLNKLKGKRDKLDIWKLETAQVDLINLNNVVKMMLLKEVCIMLR